jgi:hypothetical protein
MTPPRVLYELGPGQSLGVGLAALICGVERYVALDIADFLPRANLLPVFDQLVALFRDKALPPNTTGFPNYAPLSLDVDFERAARLRAEVAAYARGERSERIAYEAPWSLRPELVGGADMLLSHAVMQQTRSVAGTWGDIGRMLRPGGWTSHQISFSSYATSPVWNGHWRYPSWLWRIVLGRRDFYINRAPLADHLDAARAAGLEPMAVLRLERSDGFPRGALSRPWRTCLSDADAATEGAFVIARKTR